MKILTKRPTITQAITPALIAAFTMTALVASTTVLSKTASNSFAEISKELKIMDSILTTAIKQNIQGDQTLKFKRLESSYLANQGLVFEVETSQNAWGFRVLRDVDYPFGMAPPAPPMPSMPHMPDIDSEEIAMEVSRVMAEAEHKFTHAQERIREVSEALRDMSWDLRDLEREKRDLNFEMRTADGERKSELEKDLAKINKEQAELKKKQEVRNEQIQQAQKEQKEEREKQLAAAKAASEAFLSQFELSIADNLCRYGSGLRALPSDQNITFVLKNFNLMTEKDARDRVYVFKASEMKKCVQEKIKASTLLESATVYNF